MTRRAPEAALEAAEQLVELSTQRDRIEDQIRRQIFAIIKAGGSWTTIGDAMGVSKQSAWERYRPRPGKYAYVHPDDTPKPSQGRS